MNRSPLLLLVLSFCVAATAQAQSPMTPLDKSPMDMSYYPVDYPIMKVQKKTDAPPVARVIYGRPQKNDRVIFGDLVPYDMVWRLGANEATEIEFFKDVKVDGKKLAKGRYTLYALPSPDKWVLIFNKDTDSWGAFAYDQKKDVLRTTVNVINLQEVTDIFTIFFQGKEKNNTKLVIAW